MLLLTRETVALVHERILENRIYVKLLAVINE